MHRLSLDLDHDGIRLLSQGEDGSTAWRVEGTVALDASDLAAEMAALRAKAQALAGETAPVRLVLPRSQVLYAAIPCGDAIAEAVADYLVDRTPYAIEELEFDFEVVSDTVQIAAVAKETIAEAVEFARANRFLVLGLTSAPPEGAFPRRPVFSQVTHRKPLVLSEPVGAAPSVLQLAAGLGMRVFGAVGKTALAVMERTSALRPVLLRAVKTAAGPASAHARPLAVGMAGLAAVVAGLAWWSLRDPDPLTRSGAGDVIVDLRGLNGTIEPTSDEPPLLGGTIGPAPPSASPGAIPAVSLAFEPAPTVTATSPDAGSTFEELVARFAYLPLSQVPGREETPVRVALPLFPSVTPPLAGRPLADIAFASLGEAPAASEPIAHASGPDVRRVVPRTPVGLTDITPDGLPEALDVPLERPSTGVMADIALALSDFGADVSQGAVRGGPVLERPGNDSGLVSRETGADAAVRVRLMRPAGPIPFGSRGLVNPTIEGTVNPYGNLVFASAPAVISPPRPGSEPPVAVPALAGVDPAVLPFPRPQSQLEAVERGVQDADDETIAEEAPVVAELTMPDEVVVASLIPRARPERSAAAVAVPAAATRLAPPSPTIPPSANVAREATITDGLHLGRLNLIGVYGASSNRRALVRLPSGQFIKVKVGDRIDGGEVAAIRTNSLLYRKGSRTLSLALPNT